MNVTRQPGPVFEHETLSDRQAIDRSRDMPGAHWILLQRHGRRPLALMGRCLLHADNRCAGLPWWSALTIYETSSRRFAAAVCHTSPPDEAPQWHDSWLHDTAELLRDALCRHDPLDAVPAGMKATSRSDFTVLPDAVATWQFRAAWVGLLSAVFGVRQPHATEATRRGIAT